MYTNALSGICSVPTTGCSALWSKLSGSHALPSPLSRWPSNASAPQVLSVMIFISDATSVDAGYIDIGASDAPDPALATSFPKPPTATMLLTKYYLCWPQKLRHLRLPYHTCIASHAFTTGFKLLLLGSCIMLRHQEPDLGPLLIIN